MGRHSRRVLGVWNLPNGAESGYAWTGKGTGTNKGALWYGICQFLYQLVGEEVTTASLRAHPSWHID